MALEGAYAPRTATGEHTLAMSDFVGAGGGVLVVDSATAAEVTVPAAADLPVPLGSCVNIVQAGPGQVTITGAPGVTIRSTDTTSLRTRWSAAAVLQIGPDEWILVGDLQTS